MKMTAEDFATLKLAVQAQDTTELRQRYKNRDFPRADKVQDLHKRYRWDLLHKTGLGSMFYSYLNDDHIDTALRVIVKPFGE